MITTFHVISSFPLFAPQSTNTHLGKKGHFSLRSCRVEIVEADQRRDFWVAPLRFGANGNYESKSREDGGPRPASQWLEGKLRGRGLGEQPASRRGRRVSSPMTSRARGGRRRLRSESRGDGVGVWTLPPGPPRPWRASTFAVTEGSGRRTGEDAGPG